MRYHTTKILFAHDPNKGFGDRLKEIIKYERPGDDALLALINKEKRCVLITVQHDAYGTGRDNVMTDYYNTALSPHPVLVLFHDDFADAYTVASKSYI